MYDDIEPDLLRLCEDLLWNRDPEGTEKLLAYADGLKAGASGSQRGQGEKDKDGWRLLAVEERLKHSLVKGIDAFVVGDTEEARRDRDK